MTSPRASVSCELFTSTTITLACGRTNARTLTPRCILVAKVEADESAVVSHVALGHLNDELETGPNAAGKGKRLFVRPMARHAGVGERLSQRALDESPSAGLPPTLKVRERQRGRSGFSR